MGETRSGLVSFQFVFRRREINPEHRGGETSQVLRQGSNASDAVPFVHRILHVLDTM
jgi:hypothetical protein